MVEAPRALKIAVFIDLENVAIGVRESRLSKFDFDRVLKRLVEKGDVVVKRAYADWSHYEDYKRPLHEQRILRERIGHPLPARVPLLTAEPQRGRERLQLDEQIVRGQPRRA